MVNSDMGEHQLATCAYDYCLGNKTKSFKKCKASPSGKVLICLQWWSAKPRLDSCTKWLNGFLTRHNINGRLPPDNWSASHCCSVRADRKIK